MPKSVMPIKPSDVAAQKSKDFPPAVIEAFNELIAREMSGRSVRILQENVVKLMVEKGLKREDIFSNGWLNVEAIYRKEGWVVEYDGPAYCETYPAFYIFSVK